MAVLALVVLVFYFNCEGTISQANYTSRYSFKLHLFLRDKRQTGKKTRPFVRCVCQGRPSYGGNEARGFIEI